MKRLYKSRNDRKISGVCGGLATYFGIDSTIVRVIFLFLLFFTNIFVILMYIISACVIPAEDDIIDSNNYN